MEKIKDVAKQLNARVRKIDGSDSVYYRINNTFDIEIYGDFSDRHVNVTLLICNISLGNQGAKMWQSIQRITSIDELRLHFKSVVNIYKDQEYYWDTNERVELTSVDLSDYRTNFDYCIGEVIFLNEKHAFIKEENKRKEYLFTRSQVMNQNYDEIEIGDRVHFFIKKTDTGLRLANSLTGLYFPHLERTETFG